MDINRRWAVMNRCTMDVIVIRHTSPPLIVQENLRCIHMITYLHHRMLVRIIHNEEIIIIILAIRFNRDFQIRIPEIDMDMNIDIHPVMDIFQTIPMVVTGVHLIVDNHLDRLDVFLHREILIIDLGHIKLRLPYIGYVH